MAKLDDCLRDVQKEYLENPVKAVRSKGFINKLQTHFANDLRSHLTAAAKRNKVEIKEEVTIYGVHKAKVVDIGVVNQNNGPLVLVGVRSQMSSVGNNMLTYYEQIIGETISLQSRFPLCVYGYIYLLPLISIKKGKEKETPGLARFAHLLRKVSGRQGPNDGKRVFEHTALLIVEFGQTAITLRDDLIDPTHSVDLRASTVVERLVDSFKERETYLDYLQ